MPVFGFSDNATNAPTCKVFVPRGVHHFVRHTVHQCITLDFVDVGVLVLWLRRIPRIGKQHIPLFSVLDDRMIRGVRYDFVSILNTLPILPAAIEIQMVVIPFDKEISIAAWSNINKGKVFSYLGEMLAMIGGIGKNSLIPHEDGQSSPIK